MSYELRQILKILGIAIDSPNFNRKTLSILLENFKQGRHLHSEKALYKQMENLGMNVPKTPVVFECYKCGDKAGCDICVGKQVYDQFSEREVTEVL